MNAAIIVAAGQGLRMGVARKKQFLHLVDMPIIAHTLKVFDDSQALDSILLVVPEAEMDFCDQEILQPACLKTPVKLIKGGRKRHDSVFNGLKALDVDEAVVLIHDGVRPLLSANLITACIAGAEKWRACIPAIPVVDTLKRVDPTGRIQQTVDRGQLYAAQTPQAFKLSVIRAAHQAGRKNSAYQVTDDASLVEAMGGHVHIIPGEQENIKITTPEDLAIARTYMRARNRI